MFIAFLRSCFFYVVFGIWAIFFGILFILALPLPRRVYVRFCVVFCRVSVIIARVCAGIKYRVEGLENLKSASLPIMIASKHQSMWECFALYYLLHDPVVLIKKSLAFIPGYGSAFCKLGMVYVNRGKRNKIYSILRRILNASNRTIVVFPEGTRTAPFADTRYRSGVFYLYESVGATVVPVALNSGMFWGRRKFIKNSGTIVLRFLPEIKPGLPRQAFMELLRARIESETHVLCSMCVAGAA